MNASQGSLTSQLSVKPLLPGVPPGARSQLLRRSPLAVAPVLRNFAAAHPPLLFSRWVCRIALAACGSWRLEAGPGWVGLRSKLLMSFALKNLRLEIFEP